MKNSVLLFLKKVIAVYVFIIAVIVTAAIGFAIPALGIGVLFISVFVVMNIDYFKRLFK